MPTDYTSTLPSFFILIGIILLASSKTTFELSILVFIIGLILGILFLVAGIYYFWSYSIDKYINLVDNKIKIRTNYCCRFEEQIYNKEDIIKSEIKYDEHVDSEDGTTYYYTISIITKEEKQIDIFKISERNKIDNMDGLTIVVNYINYYIQEKREMY